jgi:predicted phage terminase large subunit-like protein
MSASIALKQLLARRILARRRLLQFTLLTYPTYLAGWVHEDICRRLEKFSTDIAAGKSPRLMLLMPPRHGKSELASVRFPAWHLGHYPHHEIINVGYNLDLPMVFSRKVRELVRDPLYLAIFPNTNLDPESQSVEKWITKAGGGFMAAGVGGGITGKGAHALIIDDPIKNQVEADSVAVRDNLMDWYQSTAYTRLAPGGGILIIQCMAGETQVLMADGTEKRLDLVRAGDAIATYDDGRLSTSAVANWKLSGRDKVFKITMKSGRILRANGRHPFMAFSNGELQWTRLRALTTAHKIVTLKGNVGSGPGSFAPQKGVKSPSRAEASALATTASRNGQMGIARPQQQTLSNDVQPTLSTGMALQLMSMLRSALRKTISVLSASGRPLQKLLQSTGRRSCVPTTATIPVPSGDCSATSATSRWGSFEPNKMHSLWPNTSDFILDQILSITEDGEEEVYDIQVDRTENFIANGAVSHNTMWNDDDLAGRLQTYMNADSEVDQFEIVKYPAISEAWEYRDEVTQGIVRTPEEIIGLEPGMTLLRPKDCCLHEARYPTDALKKIRANLQPRIWSALYQQNPMPDTGMYFKKDYFKHVKRAPPRLGMSIFTAWDFAISEEQHNDWTVGVTVLQDETDTLYVLDVLRFKGDSLAIVEAMLDVTQRFGSDPGTGYLIGAEDGQIWRAILPMLKIRMEERKMWPAIEVLRPLTDKMARARPLQGRMQQGKIVFLEDAHWRTQAEQELLRFPAGAHDDVVDAMAWVVHLCLGKSPPQLEAPPPLKSWKDKLVVSRGGGSHMTA